MVPTPSCIDQLLALSEADLNAIKSALIQEYALVRGEVASTKAMLLQMLDQKRRNKSTLAALKNGLQALKDLGNLSNVACAPMSTAIGALRLAQITANNAVLAADPLANLCTTGQNTSYGIYALALAQLIQRIGEHQGRPIDPDNIQPNVVAGSDLIVYNNSALVTSPSGTFQSSGVQGSFVISAKPRNGLCSTNGLSVTWVSGDTFAGMGGTLVINNVGYDISSINSPTSITLLANAKPPYNPGINTAATGNCDVTNGSTSVTSSISGAFTGLVGTFTIYYGSPQTSSSYKIASVASDGKSLLLTTVVTAPSGSVSFTCGPTFSWVSSNIGTYSIESVIDDNNLKLSTNLKSAESGLSYTTTTGTLPDTTPPIDPSGTLTLTSGTDYGINCLWRINRAGTCTTNGTAVTRVNGDPFSGIDGDSISINGISYSVASVTDSQHLVLATSAGVQSLPVAFSTDDPHRIASVLKICQFTEFSVSSAGTYTPASDDGKIVAFTGGATGVLQSVDTTNNIAYILVTSGTPVAGTVICSPSGDTFIVSDAGVLNFREVATVEGGINGTCDTIEDLAHGIYTVTCAPAESGTSNAFDFTGMQAGDTITIGSTPYIVSAYNNPTQLTITTTAGNQTGVQFSNANVAVYEIPGNPNNIYVNYVPTQIRLYETNKGEIESSGYLSNSIIPGDPSHMTSPLWSNAVSFYPGTLKTKNIASTYQSSVTVVWENTTKNLSNTGCSWWNHSPSFTVQAPITTDSTQPGGGQTTFTIGATSPSVTLNTNQLAGGSITFISGYYGGDSPQNPNQQTFQIFSNTATTITLSGLLSVNPTPPPPTPVGVAIGDMFTHSAPPTQNLDVAYYNIRYGTSNPPSTLLSPNPGNVTRYTLTTELSDGVPNYISVSAVDLDGDESSAIVSPAITPSPLSMSSLSVSGNGTYTLAFVASRQIDNDPNAMPQSFTANITGPFISEAAVIYTPPYMYQGPIGPGTISHDSTIPSKFYASGVSLPNSGSIVPGNVTWYGITVFGSMFGQQGEYCPNFSVHAPYSYTVPTPP